MHGQMKISEKTKIVDTFIKKTNPYKSCANTDFHFDFRGYTKYLRENKLDSRNVPSNVIKKFQTH